MIKNLEIVMQRSDELLGELRQEYEKSLHDKQVTARAQQLTHEVLERLRSALDRSARRYWDEHVAPMLCVEDRERATVYFPIASERHDVDSILGRWRWKAVREEHDVFYQWIVSKQPFSASENLWLTTLNELAVQGKHIDLVPQKRVEDRRITVSRGGRSVSWGSGATFGQGVSIAGAPIDPVTQRIIPTPGVVEKVETWVTFLIDGYDVNALEFCERSVRETRKIIEEMCDKFNL